MAFTSWAYVLIGFWCLPGITLLFFAWLSMPFRGQTTEEQDRPWTTWEFLYRLPIAFIACVFFSPLLFFRRRPANGEKQH